jgi:F-type H+-transporting ATPase subunit a
VGEVVGLPVFNYQYFQVGTVVLLFALFFGSARAAEHPGPSRWRKILLGWVGWIRDEMVYPVMGPERGRKFLPFFLYVFFFIAASNLIGIFPKGMTSTSNVFVTAGLAAITLVAVPVCGMVAQGPLAYWKNLVPHGVPAWLWPLLFLVEAIGLLTRPFALTVRLFANMIAGHLVLLAFLGLLFFAGAGLGAAAWGIAPLVVGFSVFILIIESFIALLQAYIFTLLSIVFVGAAMHPEH